ncbi:MAG: YiiX/YebB-like N1pC/P60 family cysteine hydrolase [Arcobacteraceae bacterium]
MTLGRNIKRVLFVSLAIFFSIILLKEYLFFSIKTEITLPKNLQLYSGDIILRKELNRISDIFATVNNAKYSHIGTLVLINNQFKVVHIEKNDDKNDYKISDIKEFMQFASQYAIYRPKDHTSEQKLYAQVMTLKQQEPSFDMSFIGDNSDNKIYCTELAYILHKNSTSIEINPKIKTYVNYEFIAITSFTNKKYFTLLYESDV